jgi:putative membrane protein
MHNGIRPLAMQLALAGAVLATPAWPMSMAATLAPQPIPLEARDGAHSAAPMAMESWSAGSATLVPLMAADMQARHESSIDAPAERSGGTLRKPLDDLSFVRQATETGRREADAAREALPQLKNPELKRIAEMVSTDHHETNVELARIANDRGWPLPAARKATAAPPSGTASGDFDARWTADMIAGHERTLALYRAQAQSGEDKDLRKFARDTLPTIEHRLAELRSVQK